MHERRAPPAPAKTRVVVVDDSALVRSLLREIIDRSGDLQCVGTAHDPLAARELIRAVDPDVITLDIEMPRMDGLDFLQRLMRLRPTPVVMVSTLTAQGTQTALRALELGAVDFIAKPALGLAEGLRALEQELVHKLRAAAQARVRRLTSPAAAAPAQAPAAPGALPAVNSRWAHRLIFIGASTGGTEATRELLCQLPPDSPAVLIAQHMPPGFTRGYAARLDSLCRIRVVEARDGDRILPGHAYVAPGGLHLSVELNATHWMARVREGEPVNHHKPSVDVLFDSAARVVGPAAIGVMLTGMGADGARAMRAMRDAGAYNYCQDEASCVVFGMPREAIAAGAVHEVLPLSQMAPRLLERLRSEAPTSSVNPD
jgi:two-component system, chemotaxis family, protein-glutamate methylesterase/glutaminase